MRNLFLISLLAVCALSSCSLKDEESKYFAKIVDLNSYDTYGKSYTVKPGDSLYYIAWHFGYDYKQLAEANNIKPPYNINVGQEISLKKINPNKDTIAAKSVQKKAVKENNLPKKVIQKNILSKKVIKNKESWQWPVSPNRLQKDFFVGGSQRGIEIDAHLGEAVKAAASGKVVYVGNGIKGMGILIIVKHQGEFLTAYGHNDKTVVKEGQIIKKGQVLSYIGTPSTGKPRLHFEMRKNGHPINPMNFLPKV